MHMNFANRFASHNVLAIDANQGVCNESQDEKSL